jgi:hypothetical protein
MSLAKFDEGFGDPLSKSLSFYLREELTDRLWWQLNFAVEINFDKKIQNFSQLERMFYVVVRTDEVYLNEMFE